ncbi:MAG TPA: isoprenylcysteine carboxylmethyltransferase family protein [Anaerolineales bacterium]|nr:isoprenylcysteine carboxylmethyltransferase family protein [Anaerolineales bacterium]
MTDNVYLYLTLVLWALLTIYWMITAKTNSQTSFSSELVPLAKLIGSALIVYVPLLMGGIMAEALYQRSLGAEVVGTLICAAGVGLAIWARNALGKNWSGNVMIQKEHHLIEEGPYHWVRHPIYLGGLLAMLGSSLVIGQVFGFAFCIFCAFGFWMKSRQEEILLAKKFPNEFPPYKQHVKMLLPYIF